ncbi:BPSL0761 family protein [Acidovorax sp. Leaf160]|uniref:BPSL0761 family protein n=1 Tax=Acidovorax sp. Leaf160 TaxID=1736280 RepID=UPI0006F91A6E|nr:BPSL0761 family protein [Acidovorax sp. Leaf160]KQR60940.1 hypothetical protein ASF94_17245 [Acidovorax sp. Leaf160]
MTTAYERFCALRTARELLRQMQADGLLSSTLRGRAAAALSHYPNDHRFDHLIVENAIGLPDDVADALADCSLLVHAVAHEVQRHGSPETVRRVILVTRHFPDVGEIEHLRNLHIKAHLVAHYANGISNWIVQEPATLASSASVRELGDPTSPLQG